MKIILSKYVYTAVARHGPHRRLIESHCGLILVVYLDAFHISSSPLAPLIFHTWCPDRTSYFVGPGDNDAEPEGGFEVMEEHYPLEEPNDFDDEIDKEYIEDEGTEEEVEYATDMFRIISRPPKIESLLLAFAKALKCMLALEEAHLFAYLAWKPSKETQSPYEGDNDAPFNMNRTIYRWVVTYAPEKDGRKGIVTWQGGTWRPQQSEIRAFEALHGQNGGTDIVWKQFEYLSTEEGR